VRFDVLWDQSALVQAQLAVLARADRLGECRIATVDLGAVPPVRVVGDEGRRFFRVTAWVLTRALDPHRVLRPRIIGFERHDPRILRLVLAVTEPVVHLELDPRRGEQVQRRRRLELLAREQLPAHQPHVGIEQPLVRLARRRIERDVAAEAAAEAAH
jgi:hypothetical protein